MATILSQGSQQFFDNAGNPLAGGTVRFDAAGTNTLKAVYSDAAGTIPLTNPVVLNSAGRATIYGDGSYKITVRDSANNLIYTTDNVVWADDLLRADLASTASGKGSALVGFKQTGTGSTNRTVDAKLKEALSVKDFGALMDGATDDTAAINAAATAARLYGRAIEFPESATPARVTGSLDFSGISVYGRGRNRIHIQASSAQFNVITTTGDTALHGLYVDGGWDGSTAGQSGNIVTVNATAPAFPYFVQISDCIFQNAKRCSISITRGGYTSILRCRNNASGLHGLELTGPDFANASTTIYVGGSTTFSDTPNGRGVFMNNAVNVTLDGVISEFTRGFEIAGLDNRNIGIRNCYQENTTVAAFLTLTGAGIGLRLDGNYGTGFTLTPNANWDRVVIGGDNTFDFASGALPSGWKVTRSSAIRSVTGAETTTSATGGTNFTACQITLAPGVWQIQATMQTINSSGATLVAAGFRLTNNPADNVAQTTGAGFVPDEVITGPYASAAQSRPSMTMIYENTTAADQVLYMRGFINISAGTIAYKGFMRAARIG